MYRLCSCCHLFTCRCLCGDLRNTTQPTLLVELRRPSFKVLALRKLQMTRTSAHWLVQHLFPNTHLQLRKFLLVSNSRCLYRPARVPCSRARRQACPCHTINFKRYATRTHHIGGCIADMYNQPHRTCARRSRFCLQNLAQIGREPAAWSTVQSCHAPNGITLAVRSSCTHATVTIVFGHSRFLNHAHAHLVTTLR